MSVGTVVLSVSFISLSINEHAFSNAESKGFEIGPFFIIYSVVPVSLCSGTRHAYRDSGGNNPHIHNLGNPKK
jgi:hypothetical protein